MIDSGTYLSPVEKTIKKRGEHMRNFQSQIDTSR